MPVRRGSVSLIASRPLATIDIRGTDVINVQCDDQCRAMGALCQGTNARDGQFVPLAVPPEFLFLTPLDDPKACD